MLETFLSLASFAVTNTNFSYKIWSAPETWKKKKLKREKHNHGRQNNSPQTHVHVLVLRIYKYIILHGKRDFAGVMKLGLRGYPGLLGGSNGITRILKSKRGRQKRAWIREGVVASEARWGWCEMRMTQLIFAKLCRRRKRGRVVGTSGRGKWRGNRSYLESTERSTALPTPWF